MMNYHPITQKACLIFICAIFFLLLNSFFVFPDQMETIHIDPEKLPYQAVIQTYPFIDPAVIYSQYFVDLDGDGKDEIIDLTKQPGVYSLIIEKDILNIVAQVNWSNPLQPCLYFFDADSDFVLETFVVEQLTDSRKITAVTIDEDTVFSFMAITRPSDVTMEEWDANIHIWGLKDLNGDSVTEVIYSVVTGYAKYPRGFYAFDVKNNKQLWKFETGGPPNIAFPQTSSMGILRFKQNPGFDVNDDGIPDIVFGTSAPANGVVVNSYDDSKPWIFYMSDEGKVIWEKYFDSEANEIKYPQAEIAVLQSDKGDNVFVELYDSNEKNPDKIFILNGRNGEVIREKEVRPNLKGFSIGDFNQDSKQEIVLAFEDGLVQLLDQEFNVLQERKFDVQILKILCSADLFNNGELQLLLNDAKFGLFILDKNLAPLIAHSAKFQAIQVRNVGLYKPRQIVLFENNVFSEILDLESNRIPASLLLLYLGLFFIFVVIIYFFAEYTWFLRQLSKRTHESIKTGVMVINPNKRIRYYNGNFVNMLEIKNVNLTNKKFSVVLSNQEFSEIQYIIKNSFKTRNQIQKQITCTIDNQAKQFSIIVKPLLLFNHYFKGLFISFNDVTEIVQYERSINWTSMAQKVAHDIKTPLSVILLTLQKLQYRVEDLKLTEEKEFADYIKNAREEVARIEKKTKDFLKFANLKKPTFEPMDIILFLNDLLLDYSTHFDSRIQLQKKFETDLPFAKADENQLTAVFQNIIENGLSAMDGKGILQVNVQLAQKLLDNKTEETFILVEIADNGKGITKENLNKVFEPYFTTRDDGTGFGLTIAKKIIDDHEGFINIHSTEGLGTTVSVWIPVY